MTKGTKTLSWLAVAISLLSPTYLSARQTTGLPPKRAHHSLSFDAARGEVILYGGSTAAPNDTFTFFDDLWSWNGQRWNRFAATGLPSSSHRLAYDLERKRLLLIGGMNGQQQYSETGRGWQEARVPGPSGRALQAMTYDRRCAVVVLFGGRIKFPEDSNETWEWDGRNRTGMS